MKIEKKQLKFLSITLGLAILFFAIPSVVDGAIPDFMSHAVTKIMGFLGPILGVYVISFFVLVIGATGVFISTFLLQWIIDISPEALTVLSGDAAQIVQVGWNFSVGITNMLLVIAFIFVAVATILGFEKFHLQKLLPRLVVVAFLVNFTLLFVGMAIDVSNFLFNSIALRFSAEGGNILWSAINPLFDLGNTLINRAVLAIGLYALMALVPGLAVAKAVAQLVAFPFLFPLIIEQFFVGFILILLSGMFFFFFLILTMRIFIVQILAIISPLAFFCWIFPENTKKHWDLWLNTIVHWLFVGVVFIFLMYIGLGLAPLVMNMGDPLVEETPPYLRWFAREFIPYILLLAYFVVIIALLKKAVPALANATISSVTGMGKKLLPFANSYFQGSKGFFQHTAKQHAERGGKDADKVAQEWSTATPVRGQGAYKQVTSGIGSLAKRAASKPLISAIEADKKQVGEFQEYYENANDVTKKKDRRAASGKLKQNDREAQNRILALDLVDDDGGKRQDQFFEDEKLFTSQYNKAKAIGKEKQFARRYMAPLVKHENLSESAAGTKISNLVKSEDDAKQMTSTLAHAMKTMDQNNREVGEKTYRALLKQKETTPIKNVTKNMKDGEGYKNIDMILRQEAALSITGKASYKDITPTELTSVTKEEMGRSLKKINSNLHTELSKVPGLTLTEAEIRENQSPL